MKSIYLFDLTCLSNLMHKHETLIEFLLAARKTVIVIFLAPSQVKEKSQTFISVSYLFLLLRI